MVDMGLGMLANADVCFKRKYRWMFTIYGIAGIGEEVGINALPPQRTSRPSLTFKEMEVNHVVETVYYPSKPDWKPINLTLYDIKRKEHPIFAWIKNIYNPADDYVGETWKPVMSEGFKKPATLALYDGCGNVLERWIFTNAWPLSSEFGELDMNNSEVVVCDLTLRYDRAYIES